MPTEPTVAVDAIDGSHHDLRVPDSAVGQRLDAWLTGVLRGLSRSRIQTLIAAGHIRVNGREVRKSASVPRDGHVTVEIPAPQRVGLAAEDIPLSVIHEDAHIIVIDKPVGLVVHPAVGHARGTLVNALLHHCRDLGTIGGELRPGIVHRLDKDTSGIMVVAKNDAALRELQKQFKQRSVRKTYIAIVRGVPRPASGVVETLIGRSGTDRKKMSAQPRTGRPAVTRYECAEELDDAALLRVTIETGRTHQIRVHMAHLGHPVLGDRQYGGSRARGGAVPAGRQLLHASRLELNHPATGRRLTFEAPLPPDMQECLRELRRRCAASR